MIKNQSFNLVVKGQVNIDLILIYGTVMSWNIHIQICKSFSLDKVVLGEDAEVDEAFWVIQ